MGTHREESIKERGTITFTPLNRKDMERSIKNKEFKTVTDLVNHCVRFFYDNRGRVIENESIKTWLISEEGEEYMKKLLRETREKI